MRQIRRRPPEYLVLLFKQPDPLLQLTGFRRVCRRLTGTVALFDIGLAEPVLQRRFADPEISGDLLDGDAAFTATSDSDDVLAELSGIGTGHDDILPVSASWH